MRYGPATVLFLLFAGLMKPAWCQHLLFTNYTMKDGLVSNAIRGVFQDSKGFLWISTFEGVSKYDGNRFTNYNVNNGLSHSLINDFYDPGDGKVYLAGNNGVMDMIVENKVFPGVLPPRVIINRFLSAPDGRLMALTDTNGIYEFRENSLIQPQQPYPHRTYFDLLWLNDSLCMAASDSSLQVLGRNYELWALLKEPALFNIRPKIFKDSKQRIWLCTTRGLKQILLSKQKDFYLRLGDLPAPFDIPLLRQAVINDFYEDGRGVIWIATDSGLVMINPDGTHQLIVAKDGLCADNITHIFQDHEKNIWFGTTAGLSKLVTKLNIRIYDTDNGLKDNSVGFISPFKKGFILAAGTEGAQVFNESKRIFTSVSCTGTPVFYGYDPNSKPAILFAVDRLVSFDTGQVKCVEQNSIHFGSRYFFTGLSDKKGHYFLSDGKRLYFFAGKKDLFIPILEHYTISSLIDKKGDLWVGTWDRGLFRISYKLDNDSITIIKEENYLAGELIRSLFEDSKGDIWVGTRYHGVVRLKTDKTIHADLHFDQSNGLTSNWIKAIREDLSGNIWLGFYQGLDKLVKEGTIFKVFNFSRVFNFFPIINSMEFDEKNSLWLATTEGIAEIASGGLENLQPAPVYITKMSSRDSVYSSASKLSLGYRNNEVQFEFSSPDFINEKRVLYSYRLLGSANTDWVDAGNQHSISYANLQSGDYRFEVRNKGWNGAWGAPAGVSFSIKPPFWETALFKLAILAVLFGLGFYLFRRRIKVIRKESELKQKIAETEMAALRAQMNPHFIFNSLNSIENFIMQNEKRLASDYLNKFSRLIRSILDSSRNEVVPVAMDMEALLLYVELEKLRFNNKFGYDYAIDPALLNGDFRVPSLLILPYVENAIVHGIAHSEKEDLELTVRATLDNGKLKYTIRDNGVGRKQAALYNLQNKPRHKSVGLKITEERILHFNRPGPGQVPVKIIDLYTPDQQPAGTQVEIEINIT